MSFLVESLQERLDEETGISLANTEVKTTYANGAIEISLWNQLFLLEVCLRGCLQSDRGRA